MAMDLRYQVPISLYVAGASPNEPTLSGEFEFEGGRVRYELKGEPVVEVPSLPAHERYVKVATSLQMTVSQFEQLRESGTIQTQDWPPLIRLLVRLANRVMRGIRNVGIVPDISEIEQPEEGSAEQFVRRWKVETGDETTGFQTLIPQDTNLVGLDLLLGFGSARQTGELRAYRWPDIVEAVQGDLPPGPEQEFLTNSIEHLRRGNLRYALLEAVICLEIVTTQFLKLFLQNKRLSSSRIRKFLNEKLGLTARVSAMFNIALTRPPDDELINKVLKAIEWRNDVVHDSGRLPTGLTEQTIREGITSVLGLAMYIAGKRDELAGEPQMRTVVSKLSKEWGFSFSGPMPSLIAHGQHRVTANVNYISPRSIPNVEQMNAMVDRIASLLAEEDPGFDKSRHLTVKFTALPGVTRARWSMGKMTLIDLPEEVATGEA